MKEILKPNPIIGEDNLPYCSGEACPLYHRKSRGVLFEYICLAPIPRKDTVECFSLGLIEGPDVPCVPALIKQLRDARECIESLRVQTVKQQREWAKSALRLAEKRGYRKALNEIKQETLILDTPISINPPLPKLS